MLSQLKIVMGANLNVMTPNMFQLIIISTVPTSSYVDFYIFLIQFYLNNLPHFKVNQESHLVDFNFMFISRARVLTI